MRVVVLILVHLSRAALRLPILRCLSILTKGIRRTLLCLMTVCTHTIRSMVMALMCDSLLSGKISLSVVLLVLRKPFLLYSCHRIRRLNNLILILDLLLSLQWSSTRSLNRSRLGRSYILELSIRANRCVLDLRLDYLLHWLLNLDIRI
jgi:hypothetical protein